MAVQNSIALVLQEDGEWWQQYLGTKQQLIAGGLIDDRPFPGEGKLKRKRNYGSIFTAESTAGARSNAKPEACSSCVSISRMKSAIAARENARPRRARQDLREISQDCDFVAQDVFYSKSTGRRWGAEKNTIFRYDDETLEQLKL